jgi:acyl-CoA thioester hydrolase
MTAGPFDLHLAVQPGDIDQLGHVNNVVYLRWVQEVATAHWQAAAEPADLAALAWVVVRHEIDYLRPARPDDTILARTWVGAVVGRDFERHTEIRRARDSKLLARARTLWCPIDRATGRPAQPSPSVRDRFAVSDAAGRVRVP